MPTPRKKSAPFNPKARMTTRIRLGEGGRIVIPAAHRKALGVEPGDRMTISFVDGGLRITTWNRRWRGFKKRSAGSGAPA